MVEENRDLYGALAGWSCQDLGDKLILKMQALEPAESGAGKEARSFFLLLTKNQANIFANYMFEVSGHRPARRKASFFSRIFHSKKG